MQHARHSHVVDVATITQSEFVRLVFYDADTYSTSRNNLRCQIFGNCFNRVKNLDIAGAPTKMRAEMSRHVFAP